jgi:hypothetical protein
MTKTAAMLKPLLWSSSHLVVGAMHIFRLDFTWRKE